MIVPPSSGLVGSATLSPDGRFLAYESNESGRMETYVVSFPDGARRVQISSAGSRSSRWARDGKEVLYTAFDGTVMSVDVAPGDGLRAGLPKPLFELPEGAFFNWDVTADGERFLISVPILKSSSVPLSLIVHWAALIEP